jgi:hypothetical protein
MADLNKQVFDLELMLNGPPGHPEQGLNYRFHAIEGQVKNLFRAFTIAGGTILTANIVWMVNMLLNRVTN